MSKKNKTLLVLPREFVDMSHDGKYKKYEGMPKLSYSQITSWLSSEYRRSYIKSYMIGLRDEGSIFTTFGSAVGTFIESIGTNNNEPHKPYFFNISDNDRAIIKDNIDFPEHSVYEDYVVLNLDDRFVIEGYADRIIYNDKELIVEDFKTGSIAKKANFYADPNEYKQTALYSYIKEVEGYTVKEARVKLLDRKGNGSQKHPLKLTGAVETIPTEYNPEKVQKWLQEVVIPCAEEISDFFGTFQKLIKC